MRFSADLMEDLKRHEGFRAQPYLCTAGRVTLGYGHNLEAHPDSILLFPNVGFEDGNARMELHLTADAVRAGTLRGRALQDRLRVLGVEWNEAEASERLECDLSALETALTTQCAAYRHVVNGSAAAGAGRTLGLSSIDPAGVRADVLLNMAFNMGIAKLLQFRRMLAAVQADDYDTAAQEMLNSRWAAQVKGRAVELARRMRSGQREGRGSASLGLPARAQQKRTGCTSTARRTSLSKRDNTASKGRVLYGAELTGRSGTAAQKKASMILPGSPKYDGPRPKQEI